MVHDKNNTCFLLQKRISDSDLIDALHKVKRCMQNSEELRKCVAYIPAESNAQRRAVLHITNSIIKSENATISSDESSKLWESAWDKTLKFDSNTVSACLLRHYDEILKRLKPNEKKKALFPLCGCTQDMEFLANKGFDVIGVELVEKAVERFAKKTHRNFHAVESRDRAFKIHQAENNNEIQIWQGDFFSFYKSSIAEGTGRFSLVVDIRSFVAIPYERQKEYAQIIENVVEENGIVLLQTIEHKRKDNRPPYSIIPNRVATLFETGFYVRTIHSSQKLDSIESTYMLVRKSLTVQKSKLPMEIVPYVKMVFRRLREEAKKHLEDLSKTLGMNLCALIQDGDLDVLRFLYYRGHGMELPSHADPGLLTLHIALEFDQCFHDVNGGKVLSIDKPSENCSYNIFGGKQLQIVSRGQIKPSIHRANAEKERFAAAFNLYVDSNRPVVPMDGRLICPNSSLIETGLDYVERLFGQLKLSNYQKEIKHSINEEHTFFNLDLSMVRNHWLLLENLFSNEFDEGAQTNNHDDNLKNITGYKGFLIRIKQQLKDGGTVENIPIPPKEIRICWLAHMLQPRSYRDDCLHLVGAVIPHLNQQLSDGLSSLRFQEWWNKYSCMRNLKNCDVELSMNEDYIHSAKSLFKKIRHIGLSFLYDDLKLTKMIQDYHRFVLLSEEKKHMGLAPGPLIDLVWHAHQTDPVKYNEDMSTRKYLDHFPKAEKEDAKPLLMNTLKAWKDVYPNSAPPFSVNVQAGCGCCMPQEELLREQEKERKEQEEAKEKRLKELDKLFWLNSAVEKEVNGSASHSWKHAKLTILGGKQKFNIVDFLCHKGNSIVNQTPLRIRNVFLNDAVFEAQNSRRAITRSIASRIVEARDLGMSAITSNRKIPCYFCKALNDGNSTTCNACEKSIAGDFFTSDMLDSKRNEASISIWDFTGFDSAFPSVYEMFVTSRGVYMLIFNMIRLDYCFVRSRFQEGGCDASKKSVITSEDEKSELYKLLSLLKILRFHDRPGRVILIGHNEYDISFHEHSRIRRIEKHLVQILRKHSKLNIVRNYQDNLSFFPISSQMDKHSLDLLQGCILRTVQSTDLFDQEIPLRWIKCLDQIYLNENNVTSKTITGETTMTELIQISEKCGVESSEERDSMIQTFSNLGLIYRFSRMKDFVYTYPEIIAKEISKIFLLNKGREWVDLGNMENCGLLEDYENMKNGAYASRDILEYIWGKEQFDSLLNIAECNQIVAKYGSEEGKYFIPALMMHGKSPINLHGNKIEILNIPISIFYRLVCLCIMHIPQDASEPILTRNSCCASCGYEYCLRLDEDHEALNLFVAPEFAPRALPFIVSMLHKLGVFNIVLQTDRFRNIDYTTARKLQIQPWFATTFVRDLAQDL